MTPPRPFVSGANNTTYNLIVGWNDCIWTVPYENVMNNVKSISDLTKRDFPTLNGVALILKIAAMHRVSDVFEPIVYSNFGDVTNPEVYDSQQEACTAFFTDLDTAVATLTADINIQIFADFDLSYGGNYKQWVKLANSLRLRLAIRVSKVDPSKAKAEGEKALSQPLGLMIANEEGFYVNSAVDQPLTVIDNSWGDIRMNASMEAILTGYNDTRASSYFDAPTSVNGSVKGVRGGLPLLPGYADEFAQKADYIGYSAINDNGSWFL